MRTEARTIDHTLSSSSLGGTRTNRRCPCLVVAWDRAEPHRVGEVAPGPDAGGVMTLGRGSEKLPFFRLRPGRAASAPGLASPRISREQLEVRTEGEVLRVRNVGRRRLLHNGQRVDEARVAHGDTVEIGGELLLLCVVRELEPVAPLDGVGRVRFGRADGWGMVGESPAIWELRRLVLLLGPLEQHLLVLGASGTGKELVAQAIHACSERAGRPLVSRNAATLPESLIDAELFGNAKNYPNPGMAERPGLVGEADGGTLFLDELGEVPAALQAHLLRLLDHGEYSRLGEAAPRTADLRLIGATNRDPSELRHDLLPRLKLRLVVPPLSERREDIPLLVRHLLEQAVPDGPLRTQFWVDGVPQVDPALLDRLLRHRFTHHVRELEGVLWTAMTTSTGARLELTEEVAARLPEAAPQSIDPAELSADAIRIALERAEGNVTKAARVLGLSSRYVLYRLMSKHGIES